MDKINMTKKYALFLLLLLGNITFYSAQNQIDPTNCRDGEKVEYCHQHVQLAKLLQDPEFKKQFEKEQAELLELENSMQAKGKTDIPGKTAIYRIPVVFHLLHNDGVENISNAQIMDALRILNRDYNLQNADANNVYTPFQGLAADIQIEFVLATKAPNGACFSGITRTKNVLTFDGSDGGDQVDAIIAGNDVYNGQWAGNKYLNIFICDDIGGAAGYTYLPGPIGSNMKNGIWVLHNYVGSIGTSDENRSRTLTHEVGHWLNLPHTWGGTNSPGLASNCNTDDGVTDTPNTIGVTSCNYFENTCGPIANVENYMDYSYCSKMFTNGQKSRMHAALNSNSGGRNNVVSAGNLATVGADSNLVICKTDFLAVEKEICVGDDISFLDASFHDIQSWNWSFPGGTPSSSTAQNPVVTYSTPGNYTVTLTASDGTSSMTEVKTNYVTVLPGGAAIPYLEGFENYTVLSAPNSFWRAKSNIGNAFEVYTGAGSEGNKCLRLRNFGQAADEVDQVSSNGFDLSNLQASDVVTFSFKYAYRRRSSTNYETLRMEVSKDCGNTWAVRKTLSGANLSNVVSASEWTPTANDWVQVHVTGVNSTYFVPNLQTKFTFVSDGGNNLFIDQINFYTGGPVNLGIEEIESLTNVVLYPNPTEGQVNVSFTAPQASDVIVAVQDVTGKVLQNNLIKAAAGENLVLMETENLAAGMYFVKLQVGNAQQTLQFVVK